MRDMRIQHLKTLMLLGVVVNHAWAAQQYISTPQYPPMAVVSWFSNVFIISGLPAFFFLAGFFASRHLDELMRWAGYKTFILRKIKTLVVPYLSWNFIFIVFYIVASQWFTRLEARVAEKHLLTYSGFLTSLLGWGDRPIDAPLWFIRDLFLIFCFAPIFAWTLKHRLAWLYVVVLMSLLVFPESLHWFNGWNWYSVFCVVAGMWYGMKRYDLSSWIDHRWWLVPVWLGSSVGMLFLANISMRLRLGCVIAFNVISIFAWLSLLKWIDFKRTSFFAKFLTPASFWIYCSHFLVCSCCLHILVGQIPDSPYKVLVLYGIFIGLGGIIMLLMFEFLRRFAPRLLSILSGGRSL